MSQKTRAGKEKCTRVKVVSSVARSLERSQDFFFTFPSSYIFSSARKALENVSSPLLPFRVLITFRATVARSKRCKVFQPGVALPKRCAVNWPNGHLAERAFDRGH